MAHVELVLKHRYGQAEFRSVFHINSVLDTTNDAQNALDQVLTLWETHLAPAQATVWNMYGATFRNVSDAGSPGIEHSVTGFAGGLGGDRMPALMQGLVFWRSYNPPPNTARKYIPALLEADNAAAGTLSSGIQALMLAFAQGLVDHNGGIGAGDYQWVCVRKDAVTGLVVASNPLQLAGVRPYWSYLTSRRFE